MRVENPKSAQILSGVQLDSDPSCPDKSCRRWQSQQRKNMDAAVSGRFFQASDIVSLNDFNVPTSMSGLICLTNS